MVANIGTTSVTYIQERNHASAESYRAGFSVPLSLFLSQLHIDIPSLTHTRHACMWTQASISFTEHSKREVCPSNLFFFLPCRLINVFASFHFRSTGKTFSHLITQLARRRRKKRRQHWLHFKTLANAFTSSPDHIFKKWSNPGLFLSIFVFFSSQFKYELKKLRQCAWGSNPGPQDGWCRRIHWAMVAPIS